MIAANRNESIQSLKTTLQQTLPYFSRPQEVLKRSYAPGKWSMYQLLVHLADTETVLLERLRRIVAEAQPAYHAFDENLWAEKLFYPKRDLNIAQQQYIAARQSVIELAEQLPASADAMHGQHSEAGSQSFAQVLAKVAAHNAHHLQQIIAIDENRPWVKQ